MANMVDVEIISRETIRPASPTPSHLRIFNLSLLDQLAPQMYIPITIFYYHNELDSNLNATQFLHRLKHSLSQTLSIYYPLAGRIRDHVSINCNDEGVLFSQAKVNCHLSDFLLNQSKTNLLEHFLFPAGLDPRVSTEKENLAVQVTIQVNEFTCGGICMGLCFLHRFIDAATMKSFLKCWAAISKSDDQSIILHPDFTSASFFFPPSQSQDNLSSSVDPSWLSKREKGIRRRFVFDAVAISALKSKATSEAVPNPTRSQVVTSFIWKHALEVSRTLLGSKQPSLMTVAVNMRRRTEPQMPENSIGSLSGHAEALHGEEQEIELNNLVDTLRKAVKKINGDYTRSLKGDEGAMVVSKVVDELREMHFNKPLEYYMCSSWLMFGFYDLDFGWGKPIWVALAEGDTKGLMYPNIMFLIDTKSGDGIEAWLLLAESHMAKLLCDKEFLSFAALDPGV